MSELDGLVFHMPVADTDAVLSAVLTAGAGMVGGYDQCAFVVEGRGQFRPLDGAHPYVEPAFHVLEIVAPVKG